MEDWESWMKHKFAYLGIVNEYITQSQENFTLRYSMFEEDNSQIWERKLTLAD